MKTFTYPIICIALFLCSCKNNSFLTQRYTNFDHGTRKSTVAKIESHKQAPHVAKPTADQTTVETEVSLADKGAENRDVLESPVNENAGSSETDLSSKTFTNNAHKTFIDDVKLSSERVLKNAYKNATVAKRGLIFGIINLALFIVICVLVVAGIVFLLTVLL